MATTRKNTPTKFRVGNTYIEIGRKYVLDAKPDPSAPPGLRESTKYPFEDNVTVEPVFFDERSRRYDTCFYSESPSLRAAVQDIDERKQLLNLYNEHIVKPYEETFNVDLEPSEKNEFWDTYKTELFVNKQFDTTNIEDLMQLFHSLWLGNVCEKGERNPLFSKQAAFILTSTEGIKNKSKDASKKKLKAYKMFSDLLISDRDKLTLILQWVGDEDTSKIEEEDLEVIYHDVFMKDEKGITKATDFLNAIEEAATEKGQEKMEFFYAIKRLIAKRIIKHTQRGYVQDSTEIWLGNTIQDIATVCLTDGKQQRQIIIDLISENPDVRREVPAHLKPKNAK